MLKQLKLKLPPGINLPRGFTLTEILVVTGLIALFSTMIFTLYRGSSRSQEIAADDLQMQSRILNAQNQILRIIREGQHFVLPSLGEESSTLIFIDKVSDIQALVPEKDEPLSEIAGKDIYRLIHYQLDMETFNPASPNFDNLEGRTISAYIENIVFSPSSANAVSINVLFSTEKKQFEIMFEAGLMNAGSLD